MHIDNWCGHDIRFIEIDGEWYAVLKDICDALGLTNARMVRERIPVRFLEKAPVSDVSSTYATSNAIDVCSKPGARHSQMMIVVSSRGIYHAFFKSRKLEAQKFVDWVLDKIDGIRADSGYEGYEVMSFAENAANNLNDKAQENYIREYAEAAERLKYWEGERWVIETGFDYVTLREYVDEYVPEEIQNEVYDLCYSMLGGEC